MIDITTDAQAYFRRLIGQQDADGMGLRLSVLAPGTPGAVCDLQFCPAGGQGADDEAIAFDGFELFVEANSVPWLQDAEIDFDNEDTGGQLSIRAPGIKGQAPTDDSPLFERVQWVLDTEVNPNLASHGGHVTLEEVTGDAAVVLRFGGGCHGCGMVDVTLKQGIESALKGHFPEISAIRDATDHATGENPYYERKPG